MNTNSFQLRHIGPNQKEQEKMLQTIKADSLEQLINETVPTNIRLKNDLDLAPAMSEYEYLAHIKEVSEKNKVFKSYIGLGYHEAIVPSVIQRNRSRADQKVWYCFNDFLFDFRVFIRYPFNAANIIYDFLFFIDYFVDES